MNNEKKQEIASHARAVLETEANALSKLCDRVDAPFVTAVEKMLACTGMVVVTGLGKAGLIAQKISATLASTGTPSLFLHAADALHGDLGRVKKDDIVLALSNSGTTNETVGILSAAKKIGACLIAITGNAVSPLAKYSEVPICYGNVKEACPLGLTPTTSTTIMLAIGDALAMSILRQRKFSQEEFALFHPAGALGRKLLKVDDVMRKDDQNPTIHQDQTVIEAMSVMTNTAGRPGAVSVMDHKGRLAGFYTDGDLRRNIEGAISQNDFSFFKKPIADIMTRTPKCLHRDKLAGEAMHVLMENKIDQIPIIDDESRPVGLLDVQDLLTVRMV